jgi:hypothetical protein
MSFLKFMMNLLGILGVGILIIGAYNVAEIGLQNSSDFLLVGITLGVLASILKALEEGASNGPSK